MSRDTASLLDVALAVDEASAFIEGYDEAAFHGDRRTRWAVYAQIILIGEAAGRVSAGFRQEHPEIPWSEIIGMRHRLVHGYDQIKWDRVWETAKHDLPGLRAAIAPFIPRNPDAIG
jgi:uncharacterized protein with HEPN domain